MGMIKFGTEGWRGVMAEEFTFENVRRVTQAIAAHVARRGRRGVTIAVGHDTRFLSDRFARAVAEVLAGNGLRVLAARQAVPTCAVSRYVVARGLPAGIMVTASHNPPVYNGIKVKESFGGSATTETVASIERHLRTATVRRLGWDAGVRAHLITPVDMVPAFLSGIRRFVDLRTIRRLQARVVVDSMYGSGQRYIESLIQGGRCQVETLHGEPDPRFGGRAPEPIASNLLELSQTVRRRHAALGIATDGDADRLGIVAPGGRWLNPGQVMCVLLTHLVRERGMSGEVVKTVSNTMMINRITADLGLRLIEVPVGFKHVAKLMLERDILIGGEESGGIGVKGYLPERDGIVNGLLVLEAMAVRRRSLAAMMQDLERRYGRWAYGRRDLHLTATQVEQMFRRLKRTPPERMAGMPVRAVNRMDGVKLIGRDDSWLLFRRSGTEPIVRVYAESPSARVLSRLLALGVALTRS